MTLFEDQRLHRLAKDILTQAEVHRGAATASISVEDAQALAEYARRQTQWGGPPPLIGDGYKATVCGVPVVVDETLKLGEFYTVGEESHTHTAEQLADALPLASTGRVKSTPKMREIRIAMIREWIDHHIGRAEDLEQYARPWWRISCFAWLHAASIHRLAARRFTTLLEGIERGDWDT